jgi:hypothetical protein
VRLVVQVQRIADEFIDIDLWRAIETAAIAVAATVTTPAVIATASLAGAARSGTALSWTAFARRPAFPGWPALSLRFLLRFLLNVSHTLNLGR